MIDKGTFVICLIKLLGLQIIITGIFFAIFTGAPFWAILICVGSLVFSIASNVMLAHLLYFRRKTKREGKHNEKNKHTVLDQTINHYSFDDIPRDQGLPKETYR